jgi:hypothetical protein
MRLDLPRLRCCHSKIELLWRPVRSSNALNRKSVSSSSSPAVSPMDRYRQDWIMSTQRRGVRSTLATSISRVVACLGSWLLRGKGRASRSEASFSCSQAQSLAREAEDRMAPPAIPARAATNSLRSDHRNQQTARLCLGSPPSGDATKHWPIPQRSLSCPPIHFPAVSSRFHRALPWAPVALCRRTERYDGKRNLHFQHAA